MSKKQITLLLILPSIGAIILFGLTILLPIVLTPPNSKYPTLLHYVLFCIIMFKLPLGLWVLLAASCFAIGIILVINKVKSLQFKGVKAIGLLLTCVPSIILILFLIFSRAVV